MDAFVVQMSGWMGSGKSTLAAAIAKATGAVVLDHDTTKSAVMASGIPHQQAGAASYEVLFALAADLVAQGRAVVIDSPSVYASIPERGMALAAAAGVGYFFIDCVCSVEVADLRLTTRAARPSQVVNADEAAAVRDDPRRVPHRPAFGVLEVDTSSSVDAGMAVVRPYLGSKGAHGPAITP